MKVLSIAVTAFVLMTSCNKPIDKEQIKNEILQAEKAFEKMAAEKGIAVAFEYFADPMAVVKRENDTLVTGKESIRSYYSKQDDKNTTVNWTPDFIDVSEDGTMAYTYGKYVWKIKDAKGEVTEYKGVFHTVWKRQPNGSWKYVWD